MKIRKITSRREFLKLSALSIASWPILSSSSLSYNLNHHHLLSETKGVLGRVLFNDVPSFERPDARSTSNGTYKFNDVVTLSQPINGLSRYTRDEIWYGLEEKAFIQSQNIQLVQNNLNEPREDLSKLGRLGEITVPFTEVWPGDKQNSRSHQIFFYGSTHWVYGLGTDPDENLYYLVIEDRWNESYYVDATHMRIIEDEELSPISADTDLERKRILVNTQSQMLFAYEEEKLVMASAVSTGQFVNGHNLITPLGDYVVNYKRPTRHMVHSDKIGINDSELYGVPWVSYFTDSGIAFHGTYWHNDYAQPRSHGCVNMPIHAAKWLYLWTDPVIEPCAKKTTSRYGTPVKVI